MPVIASIKDTWAECLNHSCYRKWEGHHNESYRKQQLSTEQSSQTKVKMHNPLQDVKRTPDCSLKRCRRTLQKQNIHRFSVLNHL